MADELTTLQLRKSTKRRFRTLLIKDKKKLQERHFYTDDFMTLLLDEHEAQK